MEPGREGYREGGREGERGVGRTEKEGGRAACCLGVWWCGRVSCSQVLRVFFIENSARERRMCHDRFENLAVK